MIIKNAFTSYVNHKARMNRDLARRRFQIFLFYYSPSMLLKLFSSFAAAMLSAICLVSNVKGFSPVFSSTAQSYTNSVDIFHAKVIEGEIRIFVFCSKTHGFSNASTTSMSTKQGNTRSLFDFILFLDLFLNFLNNRFIK